MAPAILTQRPRILFLDAYDSFSNNIVALVEQNVDAHVVKVFIDDPNLTKVKTDEDRSAFTDYLKSFDGVIAGPGSWSSFIAGSAACSSLEEYQRAAATNGGSGPTRRTWRKAHRTTKDT